MSQISGLQWLMFRSAVMPVDLPVINPFNVPRSGRAQFFSVFTVCYRQDEVNLPKHSLPLSLAIQSEKKIFNIIL